MVAVIGLVVVLVGVKPGTLVVPLAANPIAVFEFVQVNEAPAGVLTNVLAATATPAQVAIAGSGVIIGKGLTVTTTISVEVHVDAVLVVVTV
jgi:hypothetical protein